MISYIIANGEYLHNLAWFLILTHYHYNIKTVLTFGYCTTPLFYLQ